jgi:hypothetical protein
MQPNSIEELLKKEPHNHERFLHGRYFFSEITATASISISISGSAN